VYDLDPLKFESFVDLSVHPGLKEFLRMPSTSNPPSLAGVFTHVTSFVHQLPPTIRTRILDQTVSPPIVTLKDVYCLPDSTLRDGSEGVFLAGHSAVS
jgi:hypothetical protein